MKGRMMVCLFASHLAVVWAAVLLARYPSKPGLPIAGIGAKAPVSPPRANRVMEVRPPRQWGTHEFASAWEAVRSAGFTVNERVEAQRELLERWAQVDVEAAIRAALAESWAADRDWYGKSYVYRDYGPLLDSLRGSLAESPEATWAMIHGGDFGVATGMLRRLWIVAVSEKDPRYLAGKLGDLSWRDREQAMLSCKVAIMNQGGKLRFGEYFEALSKLPDDQLSAEELFEFGTPPFLSPMDAPRLKEELLATDENNLRMLRYRGMALGRGLWWSTLEEIEVIAGEVPPAAAAEALFIALKTSKSEAGRMTGLADLLVERGAWDKLGDPAVAAGLNKVTASEDIAAIADWAARLPVRVETAELFDRAVEPYLRDNPESAAEWLGQISNDAWRDRALARYAEIAINHHNNPEAARWATGKIGERFK